MRWIQSQMRQTEGLFSSYSLSSSPPPPPPPPPPSPSPGNKTRPAVIFTRDILVIFAILFFICGLLHLLLRFLMKKRSSSSSNPQSSRYLERAGSDAFERQLQQLFQLHDSGLDQAFIDALPVFLYKELMGLKEPFDCAVCLCEFSEQDKLRLLPSCSHAFHIHCIDTWLLSNSTCPLCRGTLFTPGFSVENPIFDFDDSREVEEDGCPGLNEDRRINEKRVFSVRLGKYRSTNDERSEDKKEVGETSNSNIDARRCFSMGSFQYVVANSDLQVAFCPNSGDGGGGGNDVKIGKERVEQNGNSSVVGDADGKKINVATKGDSFSVSKIWLWSKKGSNKFPCSSDTHNMGDSSVNVRLASRDTDTTQGT